MCFAPHGVRVQRDAMTSLLPPRPRLTAPERVIGDPAAAERLFAAIVHERVEVACFAYLNADRVLLGLRHTRSAHVDACDLPLRDVVADALAFGAAAVVMAHNHPSGDPSPSGGDRDATCRLVRALEPIDVRLIDHLVLAQGGVTSFRGMGLL